MRGTLPFGGLSWQTLLAVHRLRGNAYGVTIRQEISSRMGREIAVGAVYTTLTRLERDGLLSSYEGEPTSERGGRAKRFYQLTASGISAMQASARSAEEVRASALEDLVLT